VTIRKWTNPLPSALKAIDGTPRVEFSRLTRNLDGKILIKLYYLNPGFSYKNLIEFQIIEDTVVEKRLQLGQPDVELTYGNSSIGLVIICSIEDYQFVSVIFQDDYRERACMMAVLLCDSGLQYLSTNLLK